MSDTKPAKDRRRKPKRWVVYESKEDADWMRRRPKKDKSNKIKRPSNRKPIESEDEKHPRDEDGRFTKKHAEALRKLAKEYPEIVKAFKADFED